MEGGSNVQKTCLVSLEWGALGESTAVVHDFGPPRLSRFAILARPSRITGGEKNDLAGG